MANIFTQMFVTSITRVLFGQKAT